MPSREVPVPGSITQLQQRFEQFRPTRTGRTKLPEALWQAAVEQARQHGVNVVTHALRLDSGGLKKRLNGTSVPCRTARCLRTIACGLSVKGAVSLCGIGRFPVTLYKEQWGKILGMANEIETFIRDNEHVLKAKE